LVAELEEIDAMLVGDNLWLVVGILAFQQAKKRVEVRLVNRGVVIEVETPVLMSVVAVCRSVVYAL
jgi:hypothetical protein